MSGTENFSSLNDNEIMLLIEPKTEIIPIKEEIHITDEQTIQLVPPDDYTSSEYKQLIERPLKDYYSSWLSPSEYFELFYDMTKFRVYDELGAGAHSVPNQPLFIYTEPQECIYFLRCKKLSGLGSFGFPRVAGLNKEYEWKKMSFTTDIPASAPSLRYITASCHKRKDSKIRETAVYRLHAIMPLYQSPEGLDTCGEYVLVHIRLASDKRSRSTFNMEDTKRFHY